jgi:hypothetical protein
VSRHDKGSRVKCGPVTCHLCKLKVFSIILPRGGGRVYECYPEHFTGPAGKRCAGSAQRVKRGAKP